VRLTARGSKKMICEVYGPYVEGIELCRDQIREYFGEDFG
jgi:hypothetical protein